MRVRRRENNERPIRRWSAIGRQLALALLLATCAPQARAQEAWEFDAYRIAVWVVTDRSPLLGTDVDAEFQRTFAQLARVLAGATWQIKFEAPPPALRVPLLGELEQMTSERLEQAGVKFDTWDKLLVVSVNSSPVMFDVAAREFDASTRVWSPTARRSIYQRELLAASVFTAAADMFSPLARIEDVRERKATLRLRAAGLVVDDYCPSAVPVGAVMQAVVRQDDRYGNPRPNGLRVLDWTLLHVNKVDGTQLEAEVHSINRGYLGGRVSSRIKRYALGMHRPGETTAVEVLSKADPPAPLVGYEIYSKDPESEETQLLGYTDWRGQIEVAHNQKPLQVLYVRSGGMLLARLPLVAGSVSHATVQLIDDEKRLQAEAMVRGIQAMLVDLVAQRELLAVRIRKKIQEGDLDAAQQLVDRLRGLPTQAELRGRLDRAKSDVASDNPRIQARINPLFLQAEGQLTRFLAPNLVDVLASEVAAARQSP